MYPSQTIARLVGPVMAAVGIGMLVNQATYREAAQFVGGLPFIYFSGILALVTGLYILNVHNVWAPDWRSAVTAVGWLLTCVGAFRIVAPQFSSFVASAIIASADFLSVRALSCLGSAGSSLSKAT
ncbi:MAG TPA: hypothetical protein VKP52_06060 [Pseudolabrys sp.]|nr:hypothetical protein [Pseudolabrys sp.]